MRKAAITADQLLFMYLPGTYNQLHGTPEPGLIRPTKKKIKSKIGGKQKNKNNSNSVKNKKKNEVNKEMQKNISKKV